MYEQEIRRLREIVEDSKNIVFFGGAGVSTESGMISGAKTGCTGRNTAIRRSRSSVIHFLSAIRKSFLNFIKIK